MSLPFARSGMCDALSNTEPRQSRGLHQDLFDARNAKSAQSYKRLSKLNGQSDGTQQKLRLGGRKDPIDGYNKTSARLSESLSRFGSKLSNMPLTKQLRSLSGFLDGYIPTSGKSSLSQRASLVGADMKFKLTSSEETSMNIIDGDRSRKSSKYLGKLSRKFSVISLLCKASAAAAVLLLSTVDTGASASLHNAFGTAMG
ncbi:MAG: hypothetical protein LBJ03_00655, partial [Holosporales bacterium]|nr:hypothetical protein [Holosporales bacterium]